MDGSPVANFITSLKINRSVAISTSLILILTMLIIEGGSLLFIIPGIIFTVWYAFTVYEVIFDNKTGTSALSASKQLVMGRWWATAVRLVLPPLFFVVSFMIVQLVIAWLLEQLLPASAAWTTNTILSDIFSAFLTPLLYVCNLVFYFSVKENPVAVPTSETIKLAA